MSSCCRQALTRDNFGSERATTKSKAAAAVPAGVASSILTPAFLLHFLFARLVVVTWRCLAPVPPSWILAKNNLRRFRGKSEPGPHHDAISQATTVRQFILPYHLLATRSPSYCRRPDCRVCFCFFVLPMTNSHELSRAVSGSVPSRASLPPDFDQVRLCSFMILSPLSAFAQQLASDVG